MVDAERRLFRVAKYRFNAGLSLQQFARRPGQRRIIEVNMRDLMIGHGERPACAAVKKFQPQFLPHRNPALLPEKTIQMDGRIHRRDAVFGKQNDPHSARLKPAD